MAQSKNGSSPGLSEAARTTAVPVAVAQEQRYLTVTQQHRTAVGDASPAMRFPSLPLLLQRLNIVQYLQPLNEVGVGDNDVENLARFDDAELREVLDAARMLPFHLITLKRALRELRESEGGESVSKAPALVPQSVESNTPANAHTYAHAHAHACAHAHASTPPRKRQRTDLAISSISSPSSSSSSSIPTVIPTSSIPTITISQSSSFSMRAQPPPPPSSSSPPPPNNVPERENIIQHATIYGKNRERKLTAYEQAINKAAIKLALANPVLIANKGDLFDRAKAKLLEDGYTYKRGSSRSKLNPTAGQRVPRDETVKKRHANAMRASEERGTRIADLEQRFMSKQAQLEVMRQARNARVGNDAGVEQADRSIADLEHERSEISAELVKLRKKERKHQWYERRKRDRMDSGFSEDLTEALEYDDHDQQEEDEQEADVYQDDHQQKRDSQEDNHEHSIHERKPMEGCHEGSAHVMNAPDDSMYGDEDMDHDSGHDDVVT